MKKSDNSSIVVITCLWQVWLTCIYGWKDRQVDEEYEEDVEALWEALLEYCQVWDELLLVPKSLLVLLVQLLQPLAAGPFTCRCCRQCSCPHLLLFADIFVVDMLVVPEKPLKWQIHVMILI